MRAQELIHLHGLLYEVRRYLEGQGHVSPATFGGYDAYGVHPNHIHRGKEAHGRAIALLLDGFASGQTHPPEQPPAY